MSVVFGISVAQLNDIRIVSFPLNSTYPYIKIIRHILKTFLQNNIVFIYRGII